jgi:nitrate reductase NapAB chaperone NapD
MTTRRQWRLCSLLIDAKMLKGGVLESWRHDSGKVVGVPQAARLLAEIPNKIRNMPGIMVDVFMFFYTGQC